MWFKCPYCGNPLNGNFEAQLHTQVAPKMCGYRARSNNDYVSWNEYQVSDQYINDKQGITKLGMHH